MGKRGGAKRPPNLSSGPHKPLSLREERSGKKQTSTTNIKSKLKLEHLQNLAVWAGGEASAPSLAAFFGHRLAFMNETLGLQPDPSLFTCQRCETILQPGFNCTIRIEKNQVKARRKCKKARIPTQNNVVYKCHFCSHQNLMRGTPKGHMKEINPPKPKPSLEPECTKSTFQKPISLEKDAISEDGINKVNGIDVPAITDEAGKVDEIVMPATVGDSCNSSSPVTPVRNKITLDVKKRKRNKSGTKKPAESEINSASATDAEKTLSASRKRRKSWTSLKEIAERSEHDNSRSITNLEIPFSL